MSPDSAPLVIAHRGASDTEPEHTLAAYERAISEGADGWECDVRLTRDGHLVCVHDRRVNRTSNGTGAVSRHRLSELQGLDFSSWKQDAVAGEPGWLRGKLVRHRYRGANGGHHVRSVREAQQVLTLERLLALYVDHGRTGRLLIETKHPTRFGALVERRLLEALRRFNVDASPDGVTIMSMWPRPLRRIHQMAPHLSTVQLLVTVPPLFRGGSLPFGTPIAGPWLKVLRAFPEYVERAHQAGKKVYAWTVDEPEDIDFVLSLGVDAIITNRPAAVRSHIRSTAR